MSVVDLFEYGNLIESGIGNIFKFAKLKLKIDSRS